MLRINLFNAVKLPLMQCSISNIILAPASRIGGKQVKRACVGEEIYVRVAVGNCSEVAFFV